MQMEKLLKEHLDDLNDEMMKEFKWYLSKNEMNGSRPIPRSRLTQDVTRPDTVDRMVQAYGETGAAEVTVDILFRMRQNDLGAKLTQGLADRQNSQETHEQNQKDVPLSRTKSVSDLPQTTILISQMEKLALMGKYKFDQASYPTVCKQVKEKREAFDKVQRSCQSKAEHIQSQNYATEMKIKEDFEKLHTFLKREEAKRLTALREEARKKIHRIELMTELSRDVFSLSDTVKEMEDHGADNRLMQAFKTNLERTQKSLPDPQQMARLDQTKYLENLQLRVGEKMLSDIKQGVFDSSESDDDDLYG